MIPFDGQFAQNYVYPLALGAYNAQTPSPGYTPGTDAFEILADLSPAFRTRLDLAEPKHRRALQSMWTILANRASPMRPKQPALPFKPCRAAPGRASHRPPGFRPSLRYPRQYLLSHRQPLGRGAHLPPVLALYEHEGSSLHIDSGLTFDVVHNHLLITGYAPGIAAWNAHHPGPGVPLMGKTV
jgi:hypothetical protein